MALGSIQPLTEISTRIFLVGSKVRPEHKAYNLIATCVTRLSRKCGILSTSQPVTGIALICFFLLLQL
jgi:hypothetical protein